MNAKLKGVLKYWFRVVVIFFALYVLNPLERFCEAFWEGMKGFVQGVRGNLSGGARRFFPSWTYTKGLLGQAKDLRREGK